MSTLTSPTMKKCKTCLGEYQLTKESEHNCIISLLNRYGTLQSKHLSLHNKNGELQDKYIELLREHNALLKKNNWRCG